MSTYQSRLHIDIYCRSIDHVNMQLIYVDMFMLRLDRHDATRHNLFVKTQHKHMTCQHIEACQHLLDQHLLSIVHVNLCWHVTSLC